MAGYLNYVAALALLAAPASFASAALTADSGAPAAAHKVVAATAPAASKFESVGDVALPNAYRLTEKLIAGANPEGEAGFARLYALGVKTIISVDGAPPDVEAAHKFGLRYVHLPIRYDGVTPEQGRAIAKAIEELPGPIYLHCHHGKHRSAAAAAVACIYAGRLDPTQAESVLETFGTGKNYKGLWKAAREARPLPAGELEQIKTAYVERAKIDATAEAMTEIDERWDHLMLIQKNAWRVPAEHPDLDPPHEALQLQELLREMRRNDARHAALTDFRSMLDDAEAGAGELRAALSAQPIDAPAADAAFKKVGATCTACHKSYRD